MSNPITDQPESTVSTAQPSTNTEAHLSPIIDLSPLRQESLKKPLEDLEGFLSRNRLVFLLGAGCSKCAGLPLMNELTDSVLNTLPKEGEDHKILQILRSNFGAESTYTIEDLMSELVDWISIAERRKQRSDNNETIEIGNKTYNINQLKHTLSEIKTNIGKLIEGTGKSIRSHRKFVRAINRTLQMGKFNNNSIDYFILNYDTLIEDALGWEKISCADGFSGGATGWWTIDHYSIDPDVRARVFKVHGSIDWCLLENEVYPSRLRPGLSTDGSTDHILIWPAATKYREAQHDPFAQILEKMRSSLRSHKDTDVVLTVCGYGFGDEHINAEIKHALHNSHREFTVLVFTSDNEPAGPIADWLADDRIQDQVRVYSKRGYYKGSEKIIFDENLPWWQFEVLACLLEGQR